MCDEALSRLDVDAGLAAAEVLCTGGDEILSLEGPTFSAAKRSFRLKADLEEAGASGKGGRSGGGGNDGSWKAASSAKGGGSNCAAQAAGPVFCCADCC